MLSKDQMLAIDYQNEIIKDYVSSHMHLTPLLVSRDKNNNPLIFVEDKKKSKSFNEFHCYSLGIDILKGKISLFDVGEIEIAHRSKDKWKIVYVSVHRAFHNYGIGHLLVKFIENYAVKNQIKTLQLDSVKTYIDFSEQHLTSDEVSKLANREQTKYIRKNFYDKNLYFYRSLGFQLDEKQDTHGSFKYMSKENLSRSILHYGLDQPLTKVDRKTLTEAVPKHRLINPLRFISDHAPEDYFDYDNNSLKSEYFSPITLTHDKKGIFYLSNLFAYHKPIDLYKSTENSVITPLMQQLSKILPRDNDFNQKHFPSKTYEDVLQTFVSHYNLQTKSIKYDNLLNSYDKTKNSLWEPEPNA